MKYYSQSGLEVVYGTPHSAGLDLPYYDTENEEIWIHPGDRAKLPTGVHCEIPEGHYGEIATRSSTSKRKLIPLCHVIDSDFRGNIHMMLTNVGTEPVLVKRGEYICQLIVKKYEKVTPCAVDSVEYLSNTDRGENGFGSTGNTEVRGL